MDKSALKRAYKEAKQPMGVYRIKNAQNQKSYIGYTTDFRARFNRHKAQLKFNSHPNKDLQETWKTLGESALDFEILDELQHEDGAQTPPEDELKILLDMWVQKLETEGVDIVRL